MKAVGTAAAGTILAGAVVAGTVQAGGTELGVEERTGEEAGTATEGTLLAGTLVAGTNRAGGTGTGVEEGAAVGGTVGTVEEEETEHALGWLYGTLVQAAGAAGAAVQCGVHVALGAVGCVGERLAQALPFLCRGVRFVYGGLKDAWCCVRSLFRDPMATAEVDKEKSTEGGGDSYGWGAVRGGRRQRRRGGDGNGGGGGRGKEYGGWTRGARTRGARMDEVR